MGTKSITYDQDEPVASDLSGITIGVVGGSGEPGVITIYYRPRKTTGESLDTKALEIRFSDLTAGEKTELQTIRDWALGKVVDAEGPFV